MDYIIALELLFTILLIKKYLLFINVIVHKFSNEICVGALVVYVANFFSSRFILYYIFISHYFLLAFVVYCVSILING